MTQLQPITQDFWVGAGGDGSINCHCSSSATKFPDPQGVPQARFQGALDCGLSTPWRRELQETELPGYVHSIR